MLNLYELSASKNRKKSNYWEYRDQVSHKTENDGLVPLFSMKPLGKSETLRMSGNGSSGPSSQLTICDEPGAPRQVELRSPLLLEADRGNPAGAANRGRLCVGEAKESN